MDVGSVISCCPVGITPNMRPDIAECMVGSVDVWVIKVSCHSTAVSCSLGLANVESLD